MCLCSLTNNIYLGQYKNEVHTIHKYFKSQNKFEYPQNSREIGKNQVSPVHILSEEAQPPKKCFTLYCKAYVGNNRKPYTGLFSHNPTWEKQVQFRRMKKMVQEIDYLILRVFTQTYLYPELHILGAFTCYTRETMEDLSC